MFMAAVALIVRPLNIVGTIILARLLDPSDFGAVALAMVLLGTTYMFTGRYEEAIANFKKALNLAPNDMLTYATIAVAYIEAGREDEARAAVAEVIRINPKFSLLEAAKILSYKNQADNDMYIDALRKAGLPEHPPSQ